MYTYVRWCNAECGHLLLLFFLLQSSDNSKSLSLPVRYKVLKAVIEYIYTDECPALIGMLFYDCMQATCYQVDNDQLSLLPAVHTHTLTHHACICTRTSHMHIRMHMIIPFITRLSYDPMIIYACPITNNLPCLLDDYKTYTLSHYTCRVNFTRVGLFCAGNSRPASSYEVKESL